MSRRTDSKRRVSRVLIAFALSLAVHLGVLLWPRTQVSSPRRPGPPPSATEIEIHETAPQAEPLSPRPSPPSKSASLQRGSSKKSIEARREIAAGKGSVDSELQRSDAPTVSRDGGVAPPDLVPHLNLSLRESLSAAREEPVIEGISGLHAPPVHKDVVAASAASVLGRKRVESGNVDPYFSRLRETLTESWNISERPKKVLQPISVRITQARTGHLVSAELIAPSQDAGWDRGLLFDLKRAGHRLPEPPLEVFSGHGRLASEWSFQYAPQAATDFDVVNLFDKKAIPKSSGKRVELLGVEPTD